jgi:hypothetical protein
MANEGRSLVFSVENLETVNLKTLIVLHNIFLLLHSWRRGGEKQQQQ